MTRIDFAISLENKLEQACNTIYKHYLLGNQVIVFFENSGEKELHILDKMLWNFKKTSFIPHGYSENCSIEEARILPILLVTDTIPKFCKDNDYWLLNLSNACPNEYHMFSRVLEILTYNHDDLFLARKRWSTYRLSGHEVILHKLS